MTTAEEAIENSIKFNRIENLDCTFELQESLSNLCSDWTYYTEGAWAVTEYWGQQQGRDWRVHLTKELRGQ